MRIILTLAIFVVPTLLTLMVLVPVLKGLYITKQRDQRFLLDLFVTLAVSIILTALDASIGIMSLLIAILVVPRLKKTHDRTLQLGIYLLGVTCVSAMVCR